MILSTILGDILSEEGTFLKFDHDFKNINPQMAQKVKHGKLNKKKLFFLMIYWYFLINSYKHETGEIIFGEIWRNIKINVHLFLFYEERGNCILVA